MSALPERIEPTSGLVSPLGAPLAEIDIAYQPIVSTSSFRVHGFEALARPRAPSPAVCDLLDHAAEDGTLHLLDMELLRKSILKYAGFAGAGAARLFCNIDNRSYDASVTAEAHVLEVVRHGGLDPANICLEISERRPIQSTTSLLRTIDQLAEMKVEIALDDFGIGTSGLHMLLMVDPDYVKIDRTFISDIANDTRKQAIVAKLCGLAHSLGFLTVAEGVETGSDFRMARDLGCDLAQGYGIARPTTEIRDLSLAYSSALRTVGERRMAPRVCELLSPIEPLSAEDPLLRAVEVLNENPEQRIIPVVDQANLVVGAIVDEDIRRYLLTDYGQALLNNRSAPPRLRGFARRFPIGDAHATIEALVNSYVSSETVHGLILALDGRYEGYLSNHALLRLAAEREVLMAREQNPLTQLPGNRSIQRHIEDALAGSGEQALAFFDFDNFKAFNDRYGFAAGDRALLMFADMLRKLANSPEVHVGHVGGDDFFASLAMDEARAAILIEGLCQRFRTDAESLYSPSDREAGGIVSIDRFGESRFFPLLRASASLLFLPVARAHLTLEMLNEQFAAGKRVAKRAVSGIATTRLPESGAAGLLDEIKNRLSC
jgi:diguanylate cyclase (GGDEF)-like protein